MSLITIGIVAVVVILAIALLAYGIGFKSIGADEYGMVETWWSTKGSVPAGGLIALNGEAGFQPDVLRAGVHFRTPFKYKVRTENLITVPQGQQAYIFARSGEPLKGGERLGREVEGCNSYQDVRAFLENKGQRGPQMEILRDGTYAINLAQFIVVTKNKVYSLATTRDEAAEVESMRQKIAELGGFEPVQIGGRHRGTREDGTGFTAESADAVGLVLVNVGPTPDNGDLFAPIVGMNVSDDNYHDNFQYPGKFLAAGGRKGKQMQVLTDGIYYINRLFATVELVPKTVIPESNVGVVISYFGDKGEDMSGDNYSHGELVEQGKKGIWKEPLLAGKYPFNTYAGKVIIVPTNNVLLKWMSDVTGDHKLDANLREISLITKDAFEPNLPLTVVFNIDYRKASSVIQRFGSIKNLIEHSLDPMVAGYFKNIGQTKTLIELVQDRSAIQDISSDEMKKKFKEYDLELQEVLIGTPTASKSDTRIENILQQLREREVAKEVIKTNEQKQLAAEKQKELNEAQAKAEAQTQLTQSAIDIEVADNRGKADLKKAEQQALITQKQAEAARFKAQQDADAEKYTREAKASAEAKTIELTAEAEARKVELTANAEAHRLETVGKATALNIKSIADATAEQEEKVGKAKGEAARAQVDAYGTPELQATKDILTAFAKALEISKAPLVPHTVIGGVDGKGTNALEGIFSLVLANMAEGDKSMLGGLLKKQEEDNHTSVEVLNPKDVSQEFKNQPTIDGRKAPYNKISDSGLNKDI
ncbi:MAG: SPFH domain-containing protein [Clostridiaceae bacterium]